MDYCRIRHGTARSRIQVTDYTLSIGIVSTNLLWQIGFAVLISISLIGLSIGWLIKQRA